MAVQLATGGQDEAVEGRGGPVGVRLELGVVLAAEEVGVHGACNDGGRQGVNEEID